MNGWRRVAAMLTVFATACGLVAAISSVTWRFATSEMRAEIRALAVNDSIQTEEMATNRDLLVGIAKAFRYDVGDPRRDRLIDEIVEAQEAAARRLIRRRR